MKIISKIRLVIALTLFGFASDAQCNPWIQRIVLLTQYGQVDAYTAAHLLMTEVVYGRVQYQEVEQVIQSHFLSNHLKLTGISQRENWMGQESVSPVAGYLSHVGPITQSPGSQVHKFVSVDCVPAGVPWLRPIYSGGQFMGYQIQPPLPLTPPPSPMGQLFPNPPASAPEPSLESQTEAKFEWVGTDHPVFSLPQEQFRNLGDMFLLRLPARVEVESGGLLKSRAPQELIFSGVSQNRTDFGAARKFCKRRGGRLPTPEEYLALSRYMGAADPEGGDTSGYDMSLIPEASHREFFTSRVSPIRVSERQTGTLAWIFQEDTGRVIEETSAKGKWVRCVFDVPREFRY